MKTFLFTLILASAVIAGCGDPEYTASEERRKQAAERKTVFDPMVGTMDRAGGVDDVSANRMEQLDRDIDGN